MLGEVKKKHSAPVVDSRFLKIVAAKKDELQDALIFVNLNESKYGHLDKGQLRNILETLEHVAPDSVWLGTTKDYSLSIIDRAALKNKDIVVGMQYEDVSLVDPEVLEDMIRKAIPEANSISFIHSEAKITFGP